MPTSDNALMAPDGSDQIDGDPENEAALLAYDLSIDPRQEEVFLRHRSPSEQLPESKGQQEINRILEDSAVQTYHAVPVDQEQQHQKKQLWRKVRIEWGDIAMKPFLTCRGYSLGKIRNDLVAGITVALVSVPLSMSYAKLAGLPPYYGLYACFVPPMVYPIFGTSRHMAVGTAALVSLLVSAGVGPIVQAEGLTDENSQEYINRYAALAIQCSFLAGIINLGMGLLRLGFVTQFLSRAIISGFTSGAAIIIATSQLKHLFGYSAPSSDLVYEILVYLFENIDQFDWRTFLMGSLSIVALISLRIICQNETILSKYPRIKWLRALGPMLISAIAILLVYFCDLVDKGIPTVGAIPSGLPSITVEYWTPVESRLWPVVLSMVIVGFVQAIAISKRIAYKHGYEIDPSQELVGLGLASLVGGVFQSYPATGALGQSAVNDEIGAESGVASLVTGLSVMTVLLCLTPVFELMPLTVLAAIVISFVINMFDYAEAKYLYVVHKLDFVIWMVAFLGTLFLGVEYGLAIAVGASLLNIIYESVYPHTAVLGRLPGTTMYKNIKQYPRAERYDGLLIVRIDGPLNFANAVNVRDKIRKYKRLAEEDLKKRRAGDVHYIVLDLSSMSNIDTTAMHVLQDMHLTQKHLSVQLCLANPGINVTERLMKSGLVDVIGRQHVFSSVIDAVQWCLNDMDRATEQTTSEEP